MVMDFVTEHITLSTVITATCRVTKTQTECNFLEKQEMILGSKTTFQGGIVWTRTMFCGDLNIRNFLPIVDSLRSWCSP
jgi:hypothetical protein